MQQLGERILFPFVSLQSDFFVYEKRCTLSSHCFVLKVHTTVELKCLSSEAVYTYSLARKLGHHCQ
jgi:hypothetical protein